MGLVRYSPLGVFDSHCHLTDVANPEHALDCARSHGVRSLLDCGYDVHSNQAVCELHRRYPGVPFAIGLHPWHADQDLAVVLRQIEMARPAAVGEIGLDLWGSEPVHPLARQVEVLEAQLQMADRLSLPVSLHSRKAVGQLLAVLRNHPRVTGALHAYSGSLEQARPFLELGYLVGVGGSVTRSGARRIRRSARDLPLECLLLETDAPAIGMDIVEPPDVRPQHVCRVAAVLAELRGLDVAEVEAVTDANAMRLFGSEVAAALGGDAGTMPHG